MLPRSSWHNKVLLMGPCSDQFGPRRENEKGEKAARQLEMKKVKNVQYMWKT